MAPTPADDQPDPKPSDSPAPRGAWSTGSIIMGAVFLFVLVSVIITVVVFYIRRRRARNKLPPEHRSSSYHPFRTEKPDKKGLLANQAPSPENDRSTMFSKTRSSVSLYVDSHEGERKSMENVNLIPLHITPAQETRDRQATTMSNGSGISRASTRYSVGSTASLTVSPIEDNGDLGTRPTRPRSTSTTSMRYYSSNSPDNTTAPQIPKIVHTPSQ